MSTFNLSGRCVGIVSQAALVLVLLGMTHTSVASNPVQKLFKPDAQGQVSVILRSRAVPSEQKVPSE